MMAIPSFIIILSLIVFVQVVIYSKWALSKMHYSRYINQPKVFEGQKTVMTEEISNYKLLPLPWIRLESRMHPNLRFGSQENLNVVGDQFHRSLFTLAPFQKIKRRHQVTCMKRGFYSLPTVTMTSGDLLGISQNFKTIHVDCEIIVYPKLLKMSELPLPSSSWQGDTIVKRWIIEDPFIVSGVRRYGTNDTMKQVNWKATVRTGELQVNKRDFTANYDFLLYINFDQEEENWNQERYEQQLEKAISYAATLATFMINNGLAVGLYCNSYVTEGAESVRNKRKPIRIKPLKGKVHLQALYEQLARLQLAPSVTFGQLLEQDVQSRLNGQDILIITPQLNDKANIQIEQLKRLRNKVHTMWIEEKNYQKRA
ncbi:DUF58 domain-containing protein [Alkalihalobacillus trypoxylicola]|nr:DUF58 domain-containing protein [Alkalihalobacillus trypoxylicola]